MNIFVSTFISGLQVPVIDALKSKIPDVHIEACYDGLLVYTTNAKLGYIIGLPFFNNTYLLIDKYMIKGNSAITNMLNRILKMKRLKMSLPVELANRKTFRVIISRENKLVSVPDRVLKNLENVISQATGKRVDRSKPDIEYWILYRSGGICFFMIRLTRNKAGEKLMSKGELRPELAYMLNHISQPAKNDIFLDPFCVYGAIPKARLRLPFKTLYAFDRDKVMLEKTKAGLEKHLTTRHNILISQSNALNMKSVYDCSIDAIVTDPPWGLFESSIVNIEQFYIDMLKEFARVLKKGSVLVVLTARKEEFCNALKHFIGKLELTEKFDILVSGKKAAIYKIVKKVGLAVPACDTVI